MKKFEEVLKEKAHLNKIKNAKKTVPATAKTNTSKLTSSKVNDQAQLLLQLYENKSYQSIPAYKLLRTANLQQYTKGFILRGYGINLGKLALLTQEEKNKLFQDLKVLPGHTIKLQKIIKAIAKQSYQDVFDGQHLSETGSVKKSSIKQRTMYSNISKKRTIDQDKEYNKQLQRVFNEYTPHLTEQKAKSSKIQKRSTISSTTINDQIKQSINRTKYNPPKPLSKHISEAHSTHVDFKKKINEVSTKATVRKSIGQPINSQKQIKSNIKKQQLSLQCKKQQSSKQTLNRLLQGVSLGSVVESKKVMEIDLQIGKIKDLYRSFDGAVMSSTIANLDVQELVYAFAGYVGARVIAAPQPTKQKPSQYQLNLQNMHFHSTTNQQDSLDNHTNNQQIQDQIGQILRQSYMHPLYREAQVTQQIQYGDQVNSQGSQDNEQQQNQHTQNQFHNNNATLDNHMLESSFLGTQSYNFGLDKPLEIFNQPEPTDIDYFKPTVDSVFNFIKNIVLSAKMQRQISVMAASYLDTFLEKAKIPLTSINYKRLLVTCLLLASKIWDDESFQTPSFSKTFPEYSTVLLNEMEKQILKFLDYKLKLDKREYALTYFKLRKYIKKNIKSYQNRKLNIKIIRELQSGVKNDYRTNYLTKRNSF